MVNNKEANDHVLTRDQRMLMKIEMMCEVIVKEIIEIIVTDEAIVRMKKKKNLTNKSCKIKKENYFFKKKKKTDSDRNRNPLWRGNMGWRDRPRGGGHIRHGSGYGPPMLRRRRGIPIPLVHRGMNRRGGNGDRRGSGNDRGRALNSRQGNRSRAPIG